MFVYSVHVSSGEYDDYRTNEIALYDNPVAAEAHKLAIDTFLKEYESELGNWDYEVRERKQKQLYIILNESHDPSDWNSMRVIILGREILSTFNNPLTNPI